MRSNAAGHPTPPGHPSPRPGLHTPNSTVPTPTTPNPCSYLQHNECSPLVNIKPLSNPARPTPHRSEPMRRVGPFTTQQFVSFRKGLSAVSAESNVTSVAPHDVLHQVAPLADPERVQGCVCPPPLRGSQGAGSVGKTLPPPTPVKVANLYPHWEIFRFPRFLLGGGGRGGAFATQSPYCPSVTQVHSPSSAEFADWASSICARLASRVTRGETVRKSNTPLLIGNGPECLDPTEGVCDASDAWRRRAVLTNGSVSRPWVCSMCSLW